MCCTCTYQALVTDAVPVNAFALGRRSVLDFAKTEEFENSLAFHRPIFNFVRANDAAFPA